MKYKVILISALINCALVFTSATPSNASTGYRYWGYFQAAPDATTWTMAMTGPTTNVADGSVEGWVFTFSGSTVPDAQAPKIAPNFSKICGATAAAAGKKRIGVVVDFGSSVLRPKGESLPRATTKCVVIDQNAVGSEILAKVVKVRSSSSGLICGLNNYPAKECGAQIPTPKSLGK